MKKYLTEGIAIATVPLFSYIYTFAYNAGFNNYYGLPSQLISFSLPALFSTFAAMLAVVFLVWAFFFGVRLEKPEAGEDVLVVNLSIILIFGVCMLMLSAPTKDIFIIFGYLLTMIILHLLYPIFRFRKVTGYSNKLNAHIEKETKGSATVGDNIINAVLRPQFTIFLLFVGSILVVYFGGTYIAEGKSKYYALEKDQKWVVARYLDNTAILVERKDNKLTGKYKIINLSDKESESPVFTLKDIGNLQK